MKTKISMPKLRLIAVSNIVLIFAITVFFAIWLPKAKIDNDVSTMIPKNNPANIDNNKIEEDFGGTDIILVGIKVKTGTILTVDTLKYIENISDQFEKLQYVEDVLSITNTDIIEGVAGGIQTTSLKDILPQTDAEIPYFKEKLTSWDIYQDSLYSKDFTAASIIIKFQAQTRTPQHKVVFDAVKKILTENKNSNYEFYISGYPAITVSVGDYMLKDLKLLIPIVIIVVILTLFISFRRIGGIILPLITVLISTVWAMGFMTLIGKNISIVSTCIPIVLIAVGSAYGIHLITHYYEEIMKKENQPIDEEKHRDIIFNVIKRVGKPVILAAVTTIFGFISLVTTSIIPLIDFGIFCSIGVLSAIIVALVFIPSTLILRHHALKQTKTEMTVKEGLLTKILLGSYHFMIKHRIIILSVTVLIFLICFIGLFKIRIDTQMVKNFKSSSIIYQADKFLNENFAGTNVLDIEIAGENDGDLKDPEILKKFDNLTVYLKEKYPEIGRIIGFNDFIKRMNEVMHYPADDTDTKVNPKDFYEIPYDPAKYNLASKDELRQLISQYLLLYSGDLSSYAGPDVLDPQRARINILLHSISTITVGKIKADIMDYAAKNFPPDFKIIVGGGADLTKAVNDLVIFGQIISLIISLIAIFIILTISYKSMIAGLIGCVPLSVALLINFGIMGLAGIDLNIGTAMIASLAIGIGVDYTIHFMSNYNYFRKKTDDLESVTKNTLMISGKAIIFNATSVAFGFAVLVFSNFVPLVNVGILVAIIMGTSSIGAMTILPAILNIFKPKFITK